MASNADLEHSIQRYSDVYGAVLLGMHQDLQTQQQTVDKKLAQWNVHAESLRAQLEHSESDIKSHAQSLKNATEHLEASLASLIQSAQESCVLLTRHVEKRLTDSIEKMGTLAQLHRSETELHLSAIDSVLKQAIPAFSALERRAGALEEQLKRSERRQRIFALITCVLVAGFAISALWGRP